MSASYEQSEIKNVHKPKLSDMCDKCTLTTDLERLYDSLDNHNKGVLQDWLDDMWIMYCTARYTDKEACSGQQRGL